MKINLDKFNKLVEEKYLTVQKHNTADLLIWNYSQRCQFDRYWTKETLMARGLITDNLGNIKARPFEKFFNYEEHTGKDSKLPALPLEEFEVTDKLDGSLGILYFIGDTPYIATRGSFNSDQAIKGTQILHNKYTNVKFNSNYTYLFEILYPENRIVVDYGTLEDIVLIGMIHTETGKEVSFRDYADILPVVNKFEEKNDITKLTSIPKQNAEGFVIRFKSGIRVKMKYAEYVRLHRLVTGVNAKTIWELLKNNQPFDELMERVPDEFYNWIKDKKKDLSKKYNEIEKISKYALKQVKSLKTRREQALFLKEYSKYPGVVFKMLDERPYEEIIWKMIRPRADKPWKTDIDT